MSRQGLVADDAHLPVRKITGSAGELQFTTFQPTAAVMAPEFLLDGWCHQHLRTFLYPAAADQPVIAFNGLDRRLAPFVDATGLFAQIGETIRVTWGQRFAVFIAEVGQTLAAETQGVGHFVLDHFNNRAVDAVLLHQLVQEVGAQVDRTD